MNSPDAGPASSRLRPLRVLGVALARARFLLLIGAVLGFVAAWPFLQNVWDKFTSGPQAGGAVSGNTEYWCPMCPGVVSDWPSKCPVCSMTLVRREKGDMTPLPDGVVARVQLSPYRIQLAGIQTSPVEYRRLEHESIVGGLLEPGSGSFLTLAGDVFEPDASALAIGQEGRTSCDLAPDEPAACRVIEMSPAAIPGTGRRVKVRVENPRNELRPGVYAAAKFLTPVSRLEPYRRLELDRRRDELAVGGIAGRFGGSVDTLLTVGVRHVVAREGNVLCVPESAVIDTGGRKVAYVETMPGMFDALEIRVGRRYGDFYPVRGGLEAGQRVATAGAVLLDAETRLNPSVAASYFGAGSRTPTTTHTPAAGSGSPSQPDDKQLIAKQKICPVLGKPLGSMGAPVKKVVNGRVVFLCCDGCEDRFDAKADFYLQKLPK
jgi:hypothetical protein